jgi:hypothetical protein
LLLRAAWESDTALTPEADPRATVDLKDNDWRVNASRVRLWAQSGGLPGSTFKNKDR